MRVDMANRIELPTTLFFVWKNSDPPPALLAGLGSVRVTSEHILILITHWTFDPEPVSTW